jgi:hypothetical protein
MRQTIVPGGTIESLTEEETRDLVRQIYRETVENRVRAEGTATLDANGTGTVEVYTVPIGFEFEVRRVLIESDAGYFWVKTVPGGGQGATSPIVPIEFLRSGESLGTPHIDNVIKTGTPQDEVWYLFPHVDTWSKEQGPYIRNGETFETVFRNCTNFASKNVQVTAEGLLRRPPPVR